MAPNGAARLSLTTRATPRWDALNRWEVEHITLRMQRLTALNFPAKLLGLSISGKILLLVFACLYWCLDQHKCFAGIWLVPLSEIGNGCAKWLSLRGRPAWVDSRVKLLSWSSEYSFPSSHSQLSAAVMTWLVLSSEHLEAVTETQALPAAIYCALVAVSRVHEGLHFPSDVVVGSLSGLASAALYSLVLLPALPSFDAWPPVARLGLLSIPGLTAALLINAAHSRAERSRGRDPPEWQRNGCRGKYAARELDPRGVPYASYMVSIYIYIYLSISSLAGTYRCSSFSF